MTPHLHALSVNRKPCQVLRDPTVTLDIIHANLLTMEDYMGESAWIRQVVQAPTACLPVAKATTKGRFWEFGSTGFGVKEPLVSLPVFVLKQVRPTLEAKTSQLLPGNSDGADMSKAT